MANHELWVVAIAASYCKAPCRYSRISLFFFLAGEERESFELHLCALLDSNPGVGLGALSLDS